MQVGTASTDSVGGRDGQGDESILAVVVGIVKERNNATILRLCVFEKSGVLAFECVRTGVNEQHHPVQTPEMLIRQFLEGLVVGKKFPCKIYNLHLDVRSMLLVEVEANILSRALVVGGGPCAGDDSPAAVIQVVPFRALRDVDRESSGRRRKESDRETGLAGLRGADDGDSF